MRRTIILALVLVFSLSYTLFATRDTDLIEATKVGHIEKVRLLLAKGAKVNVKSKDGVTALMEASFVGHKDIL